jgi:hypothetical protein
VSIDRQFGVHEIPGTEEPAPQGKRESVSAGFELQVRGFINAIWAKLAEHDAKLSEMSSQGRPLLVADDGGAARGERVAPSPPKPEPKPWEAEGVSKATWYRRHKGDAA